MTKMIPSPQQDTAMGFALLPHTAQEQMAIARMISESAFAVGMYAGNAGNVLIACHMGQRMGMDPVQSMQNISIINKRPSLWGDAMLAVCQAHPDFEDIEETLEKTDGIMVATCKVKRRKRTLTVRTFDQAQAARAQLWGKQGPWQTYPERMLQMRARTFALRDAFADVLRGIISVEEARDIPLDAHHVDIEVHNPPQGDEFGLEYVPDRLVDICKALSEAKDMDSLQAVAERIKVIKGVSPEGMAELRTSYRDKRDELLGKKNHVERGKDARGDILSHIKAPTTPAVPPLEEDVDYGYEEVGGQGNA